MKTSKINYQLYSFHRSTDILSFSIYIFKFHLRKRSFISMKQNNFHMLLLLL